jgi:hypothetical protein
VSVDQLIEIEKEEAAALAVMSRNRNLQGKIMAGRWPLKNNIKT